jgi:hypothetical protein
VVVVVVRSEDDDDGGGVLGAHPLMIQYGMRASTSFTWGLSARASRGATRADTQIDISCRPQRDNSQV